MAFMVAQQDPVHRQINQFTVTAFAVLHRLFGSLAVGDVCDEAFQTDCLSRLVIDPAAFFPEPFELSAAVADAVFDLKSFLFLKTSCHFVPDSVSIFLNNQPPPERRTVIKRPISIAGHLLTSGADKLHRPIPLMPASVHGAPQISEQPLHQGLVASQCGQVFFVSVQFLLQFRRSPTHLETQQPVPPEYHQQCSRKPAGDDQPKPQLRVLGVRWHNPSTHQFGSARRADGHKPGVENIAQLRPVTAARKTKLIHIPRIAGDAQIGEFVLLNVPTGPGNLNDHRIGLIERDAHQTDQLIVHAQQVNIGIIPPDVFFGCRSADDGHCLSRKLFQCERPLDRFGRNDLVVKSQIRLGKQKRRLARWSFLG